MNNKSCDIFIETFNSFSINYQLGISRNVIITTNIATAHTEEKLSALT